MYAATWLDSVFACVMGAGLDAEARTLNNGQSKRGSGLSRRRLLALGGGVAGGVAMAGGLAPRGAGAAVLGPELDLRDYGAVANENTDDGPALQRALDALAAAGGGTLIVPPGRYVIASPTARNFNDVSSAIVLRGVGSSSQLVLKGGSEVTSLLIGGIESVLFENLVFVGVPGVYPDVKTAVRINYCLVATFRNCHFYGIGCAAADGGVVFAETSDLHLERCAFRGCTGSSSNGTPVVALQNWLGLTVEDTEFIDFGTLNGVGHSKTSQASSAAWVGVGSTPPLRSTANQRGVLLRNVRMDEGAQFGLYVRPNEPSAVIENLNIQGLMVNVSHIFPRAAGMVVDKVNHLTVRDSFFGFTTSEREAINLLRVNDAVLDHVQCVAGANVITASSSVNSLTVTESIYGRLDSSAKTTNIVKNGAYSLPFLTLRTKEGPPTDADFPVPPPQGTVSVDTLGEKLYVRVGKIWKSVGLVGPLTVSPPDIAGLKLWLKADAITGLSDNEPVSSWPDSSGLGNDAVQPSAQKQPTYKVNVLNRKPTVRFDGAGDFLATAPFPMPLPQPNTVFMVVRTNRPTKADVFMDGAEYMSHLVDTDTVNYRMYAEAPLSATRGDTGFHVLTAKFDGASSLLAVDGGQRYGGNSGPRALGRLTLGVRADQLTLPLDGDIAEVIIYNTALSAPAMEQVEFYLKIKYAF